MFKFDCSHCSQRISSEKNLSGTIVNCPSCKTDFTCTDSTNIPRDTNELERSPSKGKLLLFAGGALLVILAAFQLSKKLPPPSKGSSSPNGIIASADSSHGNQNRVPSKVLPEVYNTYMIGYNNPASAEICRKLMEVRPDRIYTAGGQKDLLIIKGADDKLAGHSPRYTSQ